MSRLLHGQFGFRHTLCGLTWGCTFASAFSSDTLANNFISDFAPLLSLFGQQPSTQFMSQSVGLADNIMFAMAPLGVLVIVTSAIRVAGHNGLRNLIGRASESKGSIEVELLSSTSEEVCEVWEGDKTGRVVRTQGRREIVALLYEGNNVYDFKKAQELQLITLSKGIIEDADSLPPNLVLNVGGPMISTSEQWRYAVFAILLQATVLLFDVAITYHPVGSLTGSHSGGLLATCAGTIILCVGIFACSYVVEGSTIKAKYLLDQKGRKLNLVWLQRGPIKGQTLKDMKGIAIRRPQRYDDKDLDPIWVSWKSGRTFRTWVVFGVVLSLIGWIMQVEGLRWMHPAATFAQLGATVIMLALRSVFARRSLSRTPNILEIHSGHEIDWLAKEIAQLDSCDIFRGNESDSKGVTTDQFKW